MRDARSRRGKRRFDDDEWDDRYVEEFDPDEDDRDVDGPPAGDRWSTFDQSTAGERGPRPYPDWLVTELAAVDAELGVLKTGKEADVHLLRRWIPGTDRGCLLAAKRYRDTDHRLFRRDEGYLAGRRVRESRTNRAMARRTAFGRQMIAAQWANAEFGALCRLHEAGVPVPYPVQILGTELLMQFVGDADGAAAPRLAETPYRGDELTSLWEQLVEAMLALARGGFAHGDLSAYNLLVDGDRLVMIDLPQIVDVISNPVGPEYLARDAANVATWFAHRGYPADADELTNLLNREARLG